MYKMNGWKKDKRGNSQADTYIERHFEEACELLNEGSYILNEWRDRKNNYISYTNITIYDFQHYSRHDVSHSVNILEAIELILGQNRIKKLSAGDLWLILETAYFHDIGMSLTYTDLQALWKNDEFQDFIRTGLKEADEDSRDAKNWYIQVDNLLNEKNKMEGVENQKEIEITKTWPVELERRLLFLVAEFIRRQHAGRSMKYLSRFNCSSDTRIPGRLYLLVAQISTAHGEAFDYILEELEYEAKGFGIDSVHPRFVAALLRLADLMDMDNNRFNMRAVEHYGKLPETSELHLKKHKAMTHILISPRKISAAASSDELDVCKVTSNWFEYIKEEVKNLICHWSEMAPRNIGGCIMQKAECIVYYPKKPVVFNTKLQRGFEVDKAKLTDLLIGTNIYDVNLDFLREYIQNALDATKMQIWLDLKDKDKWEWKNPQIEQLDELTPFDITQKVYEDYTIEIRVEVDEESQKAILEITDHGIGMEESCIDAISKIGAGWRGRKEYNNEIPKMPKWLRPTGGFGIGIQSAFMVTDTVEINTKTDSESQAHKITLTSPRTSGMITMESGYQNRQRGTSVKISVDCKYFQNWNRLYNESHEEHENRRESYSEDGGEIRHNTVQELIGKIPFVFKGTRDMDIFEKDNYQDYILLFLERYVEMIAANSMIPIKLICKGKKSKVIRSQYLPREDYWDPQEAFFSTVTDLVRLHNKYEEVFIQSEGKNYRCIYDMVADSMYIWNKEESVFTCIYRETDKTKRKRVTTCFKNICVVRNTDLQFLYAPNFTVCIDFMGHSAEAALKVHRNAFNDNFQLNKYLESFMRVYLQCMLRLSNMGTSNAKKTNTDREEILTRNVENNLFHYPIPIICEFFFEDIHLLNQYHPLPEEKTDLIKIVLREEKDETGKTKDVFIKEDYIHVPVEEILPVLQRFFEKKNLDGDRFLFVRRYLDEYKEVQQSVIPYNSIIDWCRNKYMDIDSKTREINEVYWKFMEQLKECGMYVITDSYLIQKLIESGRVNTDNFMITGKNNDGSEKHCSITRISWKSEEANLEGDEQEFYRKSYYGERGNERFIANYKESGRYPELQVKYLPYDKEMNFPGPYLISPISGKMQVHISIMLRTKEKLSNISYADFENMIVNNNEYKALLKWVFENQVQSGRYRMAEIDAKYREYIKMIYERNK